MIVLRPGAERGHANHGWLDSFHSFSFGGWHDPSRMGFGPLRVINEDRVEPGGGFAPHGHRDMEIITWVLEGALEHRDSMGNGSVIRPGDAQRMSAGRGVVHSEYNHDPAARVHFLQIWIEPSVRGAEPGYAQRHIAPAARRGRFALVASPDGADDALPILQDARLHAGLFDGAEQCSLVFGAGRRAYVHVARGELEVAGRRLRAGDALECSDEPRLEFSRGLQAEVLVFDLP
jgi:redox-sensitive bicupin YhaK (pirin superfamily)